MPRGPLIVRGRRVVRPEGVGPAAVAIAGGAIVAVGDGDDPGLETAVGVDAARVDLGDLVLLPGLVDTHVHVNEPGRTDWEGFDTASLAAASGGVTTLVDMPLNSRPVTTTPEALAAKRDAADARCRIDYGFWSGLTPGSLDRIEACWDAGALGFKAFLVDSGIPEFSPVDADVLRTAMPRLAALGAPLLVHAEDPRILSGAGADVRRRLATDPAAAHRASTWEASRPGAAEAEAIGLLADLAAETGCQVHIVHVSSRAGVDRVARARWGGIPLTAETCPHYLTFDLGTIPDGAVEYKCAPPIRTASDREALWKGLAEGILDLVASDHSPCPPGLRPRGPEGFFGGWGGIASLGLGLPALWTAGGAHGIELADLGRWLADRPSRLAGLERKGRIATGMDADLAIFDPDSEFAVAEPDVRFRHPVTPYLGRTMRGRVLATLVRGSVVFADPSRAPAGLGPADPAHRGVWQRLGNGR